MNFRLLTILPIWLMLIILACSFSSCDLDEAQSTTLDTFVKIYDHSDFNASFFPIDIKQTSDGGFIILGGRRIEDSDFVGVYLLKTDFEGAFIEETSLPAEYVHPVYELLEINGAFYFFCMQAVSLQAVLIPIDQTGSVGNPVNLNANISYPLAASVIGSNMLLQSYNHEDKLTEMSLISPEGNVTVQKSFTIGAGEGIEEPIIEHFTRTGRQFPFTVGEAGNGLYYFNGFYNFTFSLVFTDLQADAPSGVSQGQRDDGGISAVLPLNSNQFAISRFNFGDNFILPNTVIETQSISSSLDLGGNPFPELVNDARVILKRVQIDGQETLLYASTTNGKQIILIAYNISSGALLGTRYIGYSNPYEVAGFTMTEDGGLVVSGTTYVAGRFPRICMFKFSVEEMKELVKNKQ